jgi:chromosomal replication initiation ATPase DnaA
VDTVVEVVCEFMGLEREVVLGWGKQRHVCFARGLAQLVCRDVLGGSYPEIATAMRRNDHSTVLITVRRMRVRLDKNRFEAQLYGTLCRATRERLGWKDETP